MGTTVRKGVFETNSSSTHSISIEAKKDWDFVIVDGVVNFDNFNKLIIESDSYGDSQLIIADTKYKKIALMLAYVLGEYSEDELEEFKEYFSIKQIIGNPTYIYDDYKNFSLQKIIEIIEDDNLTIKHIYESN